MRVGVTFRPEAVAGEGCQVIECDAWGATDGLFIFRTGDQRRVITAGEIAELLELEG